LDLRFEFSGFSQKLLVRFSKLFALFSESSRPSN